MRRAFLLVLLSCGLCAGPGLAQTESRLADLLDKAKTIKPTAAETRWQQLPWMFSLVEGVRVAKEEKRPILYWNNGGDALVMVLEGIAKTSFERTPRPAAAVIEWQAAQEKTK